MSVGKYLNPMCSKICSHVTWNIQQNKTRTYHSNMNIPESITYVDSTVCFVYFSTSVFTLFLCQILNKLETKWQFWKLLVMKIPKYPLKFFIDQIVNLVSNLAKPTLGWLTLKQAILLTINFNYRQLRLNK